VHLWMGVRFDESETTHNPVKWPPRRSTRSNYAIKAVQSGKPPLFLRASGVQLCGEYYD
jgi:hypothetical protein